MILLSSNFWFWSAYVSGPVVEYLAEMYSYFFNWHQCAKLYLLVIKCIVLKKTCLKHSLAHIYFYFWFAPSPFKKPRRTSKLSLWMYSYLPSWLVSSLLSYFKKIPTANQLGFSCMRVIDVHQFNAFMFEFDTFFSVVRWELLQKNTIIVDDRKLRD